ncbi:glycoside hydrolase domain-containing protein [Acinetobacter sp. VT 511]|uniref:glycoside hydrolase domain-containing protein n=1 Tax=Acinetobacter sp. VT 511 TaxID=1675902 RepID=UPI001BB2D3BB|nr:glycoside hydrolase domain-containing protein [Acinetobacter sp. VT 511]
MVRHIRSGSSLLKSFAGLGHAGKAAPEARLSSSLEVGPGWVRVGNRRRVDVGDRRTVQAYARANLAPHATHWNFDRVRNAAAARWNAALGGIAVEGGTPDQRVVMASAFYHALLAPTLLSDVDGRYPGLDGKIQQVPADAAAYSSYSLWDVYRAQLPLLTLVAPERSKHFVDDLIRQTAQSPFGPLVWPLQGKDINELYG